jgi:hypothetical protein
MALKMPIKHSNDSFRNMGLRNRKKKDSLKSIIPKEKETTMMSCKCPEMQAFSKLKKPTGDLLLNTIQKIILETKRQIEDLSN